MRAFATELQRGAIMRDDGPRHRARRLLKGGKYKDLVKEPRRGVGVAGTEKHLRLKRQWDAKRRRKTKPWPSQGVGGYVADEDHETDEIRGVAKELQRSNYLMQEYLRKTSFYQACDEAGILPSDLVHKPIEDFQKVENRAFDRTFQEQKAAYDDHEQYRARLIRKVLIMEQRLVEVSKKKKILQERESKQMRHLLESSIIEERKRLQKASAVNDRIEKAKIFQFQAAQRNMQVRQKKLKIRLERANASQLRTQKAFKQRVREKAKEKQRREQAAADFRLRKGIKLREAEAERRQHQIRKAIEVEAKLQKQREALKKSKLQARNLAGQRAEKEAQLQEQLRRQQEQKLERKEKLISKIKKDKEAALKLRSFKQNMEFERRRKQAERLAIAQQRKGQHLAREIKIRDQRASVMKEIQHALRVERKSVQREAKISLDKWKQINGRPASSLEPGPGDYDLPNVFSSQQADKRSAALGGAGGGWRKNPKPKTEFDRIVDRAREVPAPGEYFEIDDPRISSFHTSHLAGEWGDYKKPKNEFELAMDRANDTPAGQDYDPTPLKSNVGSVSMHGEKPADTPLDIAIRRAADLPSSAAFQPNQTPPPMRSLAELRSQLQVSANVLGFIGKLTIRRKAAKAKMAAGQVGDQASSVGTDISEKTEINPEGTVTVDQENN